MASTAESLNSTTLAYDFEIKNTTKPISLEIGFVEVIDLAPSYFPVG
jgi:hypothetical protein